MLVFIKVLSFCLYFIFDFEGLIAYADLGRIAVLKLLNISGSFGNL
jgi:hypothetical protein